MPSYSQVKPHLADAGVTSTATFTASGHVVTVTDVADFMQTFRGMQIEAVKVKVKAQSGENATALPHMVFLNGTNTFATVNIGTAADESWVEGTITASNARLAEDVEPTVNVVTTGTASSDTGVTQGTYDIWFEA